MIYQAIGRLKDVNLLAIGSVSVIALTSSQMFMDPDSEASFFPLFTYAVLRSKVGGAVTTTARIRCGGNANHDDVMPLFVVAAGAQVGAFSMPPIVASPYVPVNLRAGPIIFEVERAAIGPTTLTGDIMVIGIVVSG